MTVSGPKPNEQVAGSLVNTEPFDFQAGKTGVLLIHGWTGTPSEMRPLGHFLHEHGYTVKGIRLTGHGGTPEELVATGSLDWWKSVVQGYREIAAECEKVVVAGLSMGGCLSLALAGTVGRLQRMRREGKRGSLKEEEWIRLFAEEDLPKLQGVVSMCAPVWVHDRRAKFARWICRVYPYSPNNSVDPAHIAQYTHRMDRTPVRSVYELFKIMNLMKQRLADVDVPTLLLQSRLDRTVQIRSAEYIQQHIRTPDCELRWYEHSDHMLVIDHDREQVYADVLSFIKRVEFANNIPKQL